MIEEMLIAEKLRAWESYAAEYMQAKKYAEVRPSSRRRIAQFLIGLGLMLDPDAAEQTGVPVQAIAACAAD